MGMMVAGRQRHETRNPPAAPAHPRASAIRPPNFAGFEAHWVARCGEEPQPAEPASGLCGQSHAVRERFNMSSIGEAVRRRAYELWEQAGQPEGRNEEFWFAAIAELEGRLPTLGERVEALGPPFEEPSALAVQHGIPVGMPGERIVEQGVDAEGLENLLMPHSPRKAAR